MPRPGAGRLAPVAGALLLLLALVMAACGASTVSPPASAPASSPASASASADASGALAPAPSATHWPGGVVEAVVILGKADAQIQAAGADLGAAADYQDLQAMWSAADGLATLVARLRTQVPRIASYPETAAAAKALEAAFPDMETGARMLADSIKAGDAAGVESGSQQLAKGLAAYGEARKVLGPLVDQALLMQRLLLK